MNDSSSQEPSPPEVPVSLMAVIGGVAVVGLVVLIGFFTRMGGGFFGGLLAMNVILAALVPMAGGWPVARIRVGQRGYEAARKLLACVWTGFGLFFVALILFFFAPESVDKQTWLMVLTYGYCTLAGLQMLANLVLGVVCRRRAFVYGLVAEGVAMAALVGSIQMMLSAAAAG